MHFKYSNHQETDRQKLNGQLLKNAPDNLNYFFLLQKKQLDFVLKSHEKLFKEKLVLDSLEQSKTNLQQVPIFKIYGLINEALSKSTPDNDYLKLESLFKNEIDKFGRIDKVIVIKILFNYFISQINKGNEKDFHKIFSLYKFGLKQKLLVEKHQISGSIFTNIITTGVNLKEFEWTEKFIEDYKKYLPRSVKDDATNFGLSLLFFHKKEFSKTIEIIVNHTFSKPLQILHSKTILLRAYFEQYLIDDSYYELLFTQTQAFEKFIRRNDLISELKKERYLNFVLFIRKIASGHWQNSLDKNLIKKLNDSNEVMLKFWLIEKIKTLQLKRGFH